jgi:ubiquitin carboxyl-terminal hydrolase 22/27/51
LCSLTGRFFQRFEFKNGHNKAASKVDTKVQFPLQLSMAPYTNVAANSPQANDIELSRQCTYELMSVVVHEGEIETGHYYSYCRVGDQVSRDDVAASRERGR